MSMKIVALGQPGVKVMQKYFSSNNFRIEIIFQIQPDIWYDFVMSGCLYMIKQFLPDLAPSERKVAECLLANPTQAVSMGIKEVAYEAKTSASACIRFAKRLGYEGYSELRMSLAKEVFSSEAVQDHAKRKQVGQCTSAEELVHLVADTACDSLGGMKAVVDGNVLEKAVEAILRASHILVSGIGASGLVAMDLQQKLARLGQQASYNADSDMQIVEACALGRKDVLVAISYSGETNSVLKVVKEAKANGATVIAIARIGGNSLSKAADLTLHVANSEPLFRESATLSRLGQLLVVDFIYTMILARRHQQLEPLLNRSWKAVAHVSG
jgi:DNA-binding MurR/RpiR family transcriptional regulator